MLDCNTLGNDTKLNGSIGSIYSIHCNSNCLNSEYNIYGNFDDGYSDDSNICISAIHSNTLTNKGGETRLLIQNGNDV